MENYKKRVKLIAALALTFTITPILAGCPSGGGGGGGGTTFVPSQDYYGVTSNNDGSLLVDRPFYEDGASLYWLSAFSSSLSGVCKHYGLGTYLSGLAFGDFDRTAVINSSGKFQGFDTDADNAGIEITICDDNTIHTDIEDTLPPIPLAEERSTDVFYDFPYAGEVTIYEPYVLRSTADLTAGDEFIPLGINNSIPDGVCSYFGFGKAIDWEVDTQDWELTAIIGSSSSIEAFDFRNTEYFNDGYYSITCQIDASKIKKLGKTERERDLVNRLLASSKDMSKSVSEKRISGARSGSKKLKTRKRPAGTAISVDVVRKAIKK